MVREFCRSRHILAPAPSARTHERNSACSTHGKISLPSYEDSLDHVGIAVEYGRTGVSSIRVEVCHEKCLWLVVSYGGSAGKLGWQPDRVSNDVNLLGIGDFSLRPYLRERVIGYGTIDARLMALARSPVVIQEGRSQSTFGKFAIACQWASFSSMLRFCHRGFYLNATRRPDAVVETG
jgi:hypothetical protein